VYIVHFHNYRIVENGIVDGTTHSASYPREHPIRIGLIRCLVNSYGVFIGYIFVLHSVALL